MDTTKMVLRNLVENGLVDTAREGKGGTDGESNVTDIHCHVQVR